MECGWQILTADIQIFRKVQLYPSINIDRQRTPDRISKRCHRHHNIKFAVRHQLAACANISSTNKGGGGIKAEAQPEFFALFSIAQKNLRLNIESGSVVERQEEGRGGKKWVGKGG